MLKAEIPKVDFTTRLGPVKLQRPLVRVSAKVNRRSSRALFGPPGHLKDLAGDPRKKSDLDRGEAGEQTAEDSAAEMQHPRLSPARLPP